MILTDEEREALGHRIAWRYKKSSDPHHSDTYTFNRATLLQFSEAVEKAVAAAVAKRCADLCVALRDGTLAAQSGPSEDLSNMMLRQVAHLGHNECADAIRQEFGEVSK